MSGRNKSEAVPQPTESRALGASIRTASKKSGKGTSRAIPLSVSDYLQKILTARVYDVALETPLELARSLSKRIQNQVFLKREDCQQVFSFKLRGAYNKMAHLGRQPRARGGARCQAAGLQGDDRDAGDDTAPEDRRGEVAGRVGGAAWRELFGRLRARPRA